jgi:hypothetical protein
MSSINPSQPNAPIPGANYTSDTRNYPWHRPPDITSTDEALEHVMEVLTETDAGKRYMSLIEAGTPIASITDIVVTLAVGRGKFSIDFAILIAGPVTRMLEIMAKSYEIEYDLGIDVVDTYTSSVVLKQIKGVVEESVDAPIEEEPTEEPAGFMSAVSEEEQSSMLGYDVEEAEEDE